MSLFALGLNHHTAPIAIRERLAFPQGSVSEALGDLEARRVVDEAALISTCNRTELYCSAASIEAATDWLAQYRSITLAEISPYLFACADEDAIRHIFRVACGLDSMVLGEPQILGQLKEATRVAKEAGTLGVQLHKLLQTSFTVAKDVRSNTAIGTNIVSMAAAAVRLAARIFERLADTRILFVGAGEMMELCATHFASAAPRQISIANRTRARAEALATRLNADILPLDALGEALPRYDIVVTCTASPLPLIGRGMADRAIRARRHRPMVMVDLAVPRDIEPEVAGISDIFLYTVDDLAQVVSSGRESRQTAIAEAEAIIEASSRSFHHWLNVRDAVPAIRQLRDHADTLRAAELAHARRLLARGDDPQDVLEALSQRLTNKLLHGPTRFLTEAGGSQAAGHAVDVIQQIYQLDSEPEQTEYSSRKDS